MSLFGPTVKEMEEGKDIRGLIKALFGKDRKKYNDKEWKHHLEVSSEAAKALVRLGPLALGELFTELKIPKRSGLRRYCVYISTRTSGFF
jgi:hypothetical protein